jgi:molecular chaperone GrpE (heat shock protein)
MNHDPQGFPRSELDAAPRDDNTLGSSTLHELCAEMIRLREKNDRQHKLFDQTLTKVREALQSSFNSFAADTQRAYQQLRQEMQGEKKFSLGILTTLLEIGQELEHLRAIGETLDPTKPESVKGYLDGIAVQSRKVQASLKQVGIVPYEPQPGTPYNPALHERVGSARFEGIPPLMVGRTAEPGFASQQPDFKLVRAKVIVSE